MTNKQSETALDRIILNSYWVDSKEHYKIRRKVRQHRNDRSSSTSNNSSGNDSRSDNSNSDAALLEKFENEKFTGWGS